MELNPACVLVLGTAVLPAAAAYARAKYFFRYPRRSQHLLMTMLTLAVLVGVIPLQEFLRQIFQVNVSNGVLRAVTIAQYAGALVAFLWKLASEQRKLSPERLAQLAALNKQW